MKKYKLTTTFLLMFIIYIIWIKFFTTGGKIFMIWNVFLAFIPYLLSCYLYNLYYKKEKVTMKILKLSVVGVLWLLFYPNAPYMLTDFMHLSGEKFYLNFKGGAIGKYSMNIYMWKSFFTLVSGIFLGVFLGVISLNKIHSILTDRLGKYKAFLLVIIINYLSGFAIFIGRFSRYNSWDVIVNPYNIFRIISNEMTKNAILFTWMFGTLSLMIYYLYYISRMSQSD